MKTKEDNNTSALADKVRGAVESLLNTLDPPEDDLRLAIRDNRRIIRRAIDRGATMSNLRKHFVAAGVKCSIEHLRGTLQVEGLWPKKNGDGDGSTTPAPTEGDNPAETET
jgi:hypothetical protein